MTDPRLEQVCSFCGRSENQVATLIKHQDGIAICDVCVEHAHQIVAMSRAGRKSINLSEFPTPREIGGLHSAQTLLESGQARLKRFDFGIPAENAAHAVRNHGGCESGGAGVISRRIVVGE